MTIHVIKNTQREAVVKLDATGTVAVKTTILGTFEELDGITQTVNVIGIAWTCANAGSIEVTRNAVKIFSLSGSGSLDLDGQLMPPDTVENTSDILVTITGNAQVWLRLRKQSGYKSKSGEYTSYGSYEDETRVGASTTVSGSPDYIPPGP